MDKCTKVAGIYIATLKTMVIIYQSAHWTTKGLNFYGSHLLFERLYNSTLENLDTAAEKFIGIFGDECLNYEMQASLLSKITLKYKNYEGSPFDMAMAIEKDFLKFSKDAYDCFETEGNMTLGLDDMIMAIASDREEAVYLLQQSKSKE